MKNKFRAWQKKIKGSKAEMFNVIMLSFKQDGEIIAKAKRLVPTDNVITKCSLPKPVTTPSTNYLGT